MPVCKKVNKDFFKKWSPEMAYVLGFFMADGSLDANRRGSHYLSIQICDKELLYAIRDALGSDHKISHRKRFGNESDLYRLQIGSKEMFNDIKKLGVYEQKTYTMDVPSVPDKYFGDFVRGYFDGDGHVWVGIIHKKRRTQHTVIQTGFTSCSGNFLAGLRGLFLKKGMGKGCIYNKKNASCLKYSIEDSLLLYNLMYTGFCDRLFLQRKKVIFDNFFKKYKMRP